ncbi:hypothetical protein HF576_10185 [Microbacterium sp. CFH 90308]|uniref:DUF5134 domain-containing protein n=1 Tax=Microbacterium salsuginis TaxID=2722803 RepID=A0ABX1KB14_9MICO|nr:hypothetical protein [Microbacterium sp. CFH 90308]NLP84221.1 hypothetical protein [Microbacterium sp. CFH 90308]
MSELLHAGALLPAVLGTGALVRDRRLRPVPEVVASILMLVGMADAMLWHVVAPVYWSAALVVVALGLVVGRRRGPLARGRSTPARDVGAHVALTAHVALGLVVMAALLVAGATSAPPASTVDGHCHSCGGGVDGIRLMTLALCAGYVLLTEWCSRSARHRSGGRLHYWMMAVSAVTMGAMTLA